MSYIGSNGSTGPTGFSESTSKAGWIGPVTQDIINAVTKELKKKDTRSRIITNIIDPVVIDVVSRYTKYISSFFVIQLVIICLLIYIIYLIKNPN